MTAQALREVEFTDDDFARITTLVRSRMGISLAPTKRPLVYSRLIRRLRALGLTGFPAYIDLLHSPNGEAEREQLITAVTTNVTAFFRERHHFDQLKSEVLPPLIARARSGGRVRIWSAACSSGEEPYSIASCVHDLCPEAGRLDIRILSTDIDRAILERAETGLYPIENCAAVPPDLGRKLFSANTQGDQRSIAPDLRALITFRRLNLIEQWPMRGPFDIIFCRNVVIYFDRDTQETLWSRFLATLPEGGALMIGHSERVTGPATPHLVPNGITSYRKQGV
ncbi:MAG: protein-glutamate O-methyltransferase [Pseudomonadota bacterium]